MAVFDTMRLVGPDVSTVCVGLAASMGAFLLASGHKVYIAQPTAHSCKLVFELFSYLKWQHQILDKMFSTVYKERKLMQSSPETD